jgi:integrase/recombinase XerC
MTATPTSAAASQQAAVDAALLILERMGLSADDLTATATPTNRAPVPTFADYVPIVSAAVTDGTRKAYGSYWNRVVEQWGARRLDEPTPSEVRQLVAYVKAHAVPRRNARGGRSAAENLIGALRCLYRHAQDDGLIDERDSRGGGRRRCWRSWPSSRCRGGRRRDAAGSSARGRVRRPRCRRLRRR